MTPKPNRSPRSDFGGGVNEGAGSSFGGARKKGAAASAIAFIEKLLIPEGPRAGQRLKLAGFQKDFIRGALAPGVQVGVLSVGRGNAKSALSASIALASLLGEAGDRQPRREIVLAARTQAQAGILHQFAIGFCRSLPEEVQSELIFRRSPRMEIEYTGDGGGHKIMAIAAEGRNALGLAPTLCVMDERGHWPVPQGDDLEHALTSALGKRNGRALIISTSAANDVHPFSKWLDEDQSGVFRLEFRAPDGCALDDIEAIKAANPGALAGIGSSLEWLLAQGRRAQERGGSEATAFRLYNLNQRVSDENRDVVLTVDEWLSCEVTDLPAREGPCVIGVDLGGSASMSAASYYWPQTHRLECWAALPSKPSLLARGESDGVKDRYVEMQKRGELVTMGAQTVPVKQWLAEVARHVDGEKVACIVADRFKRAELADAIDASGLRCPVIWRGFGFLDGNTDLSLFKRKVLDGEVKAEPSLLLRSGFSDAVVLRDPAANMKLAKGRSLGRIDAVAATIIAVGEGARMTSRPVKQARQALWV
ncbi:terminase [Methylocystis sp. H4A]|uniref:terminase TerL endonuclease subunit n=1 Tax=Methylocystis sp. H4A TaxID=2785788 RepID=UPI0018C2D02B|nr:terminase TerL endonuclease subunit [Methylocystis sp. H4A]MBG0802119.1 terminase [Methylocystis sp. H4A]